jgi:hypothetical protein
MIQWALEQLLNHFQFCLFKFAPFDILFLKLPLSSKGMFNLKLKVLQKHFSSICSHGGSFSFTTHGDKSSTLGDLLWPSYLKWSPAPSLPP